MPDTLPAALSSLSRLQLCHLERWDERETAAQVVTLPSGPWLGSLRWLSADIGTLLSSVEALHTAAALECVSVAESSADSPAIDWSSLAAAAFFDWLAHHPPLRRLSIEWPGSESSELTITKGFLVQFAQLCRRRPSLVVHFLGPTTEGQSLARHLRACHRF